MGLTSKDLARFSQDAQKQILQKVLQKERKLKNQPCDYIMPDGTTQHFDSKKERDRFAELLLLQKAGKISDLECQAKYVLIPVQRRDDGTVERECSYYADFVYRDGNGNIVVEDVKGYKDTSSATYAKFVIKRKLLLERYGITIHEV